MAIVNSVKFLETEVGKEGSSGSSGKLIDVTLQDIYGTRLYCVTVQFVCS